MASHLLIFLRISRPQCVKSTAESGGLASNHDLEGPVRPQRGTAAGQTTVLQRLFVCLFAQIHFTEIRAHSKY